MTGVRLHGRSERGFTLLELVVTIVLSAIVGSFIVLFLATPLKAYFAETRRSTLIDSTERIGAAVRADARTALPNSMRVATRGRLVALELLATAGTARYYGAGEKNHAAGQELTPGIPVSSFETLNAFEPGAAGAYRAAYLAVGNLGTAGHDAYQNLSQQGVMTPAGETVSVTTPVGSAPGENRVTLGQPMTFLADGLPSPVHAAYLVQGPVSYVCDIGAGTVRRYANYPITALQSVPPRTRGALIATDVTACRFSVVTDPLYGVGELAVLEVTVASQGESMTVFLEAPTEYAR